MERALSIHPLHATDADEQSAIPLWIASAFRRTEGRDPLGLQSITIDRIMPRLVPSILALSRRARYFSFYPFLLDEVFRRAPSSSQDDLARFIKAREYEYALAVQLCPRGCGERASAVVGGLRAGPKVRSGIDLFERDESVESYLGGYGLYYRTPLIELSLVAPKGEIVPQIGEPLPRDVLRPGRALSLAERFRAAIADTRYYQEFFLGTQPMPRSVLTELATRACLCRLGTYTEERSAIQDAILGLPDRSSQDKHLDTQPVALAEQRRRSFALILGALDHAPDIARGAEQLTSRIRRTVWNEFLQHHGEASKLGDTLGQWSALVAKDYAQDGLASIWSEFCRRGHTIQPVDGMLPDALDRFLRVDLLTDATVDLGISPLSVDSQVPTREFAATLADHLALLDLEDVRGWTAKSNTAIAGLVLLLELRSRLTQQVAEHPTWRAIAQQASNWQPGLRALLAQLDWHLEDEPNLGDTLAWVTKRFIIDVHERVAYSKLPDFTFRFRWEEDRLRFYGIDPRRFDPSDIRVDAISRLSED